jgi:hypothetical protein
MSQERVRQILLTKAQAKARDCQPAQLHATPTIVTMAAFVSRAVLAML